MPAKPQPPDLTRGGDDTSQRPQPGQRIARYLVVEPIGAGAMGQVYRARDEKLGREVALKVLRGELSDDADGRARFEREARVLASLNHPSIATLYGFEEESGLQLLVLELVDGDTLDRLLENGPLEVDRALDIAREIAEGLRAAHDAGVVHRDLKPANVKITSQGRVKILDFGIARWVSSAVPDDAPTAVALTRAGGLVGTPAYMSPEQARGQTIDARADVWAFGAVLYEMLSGRRAFGGPTTSDVLASVLTRDPDWSALPAAVPSPVRDLLRRCLDKDPGRRLAQLGEARAALERASGAALLVWALREAIPEIQRRIETEDNLAAQELLREIEPLLGPDDATVRKAWVECCGTIEVTTDPPGASVSFQRYEDFGGAWRPLGTTPVRDERFPRGVFRLRIEKPGFTTIEVPYNVTAASYVKRLTETALRRERDPSTRLDFHLTPEGNLPENMVPVEAGIYDPVPLVGLAYGSGAEIPAFLIDRTEVTNRAYQEFVASGGYQRRELWPERIEIDGREVPWEEAVRTLVDTTGRPGPAGWELGEYPAGQADHPVAGVSWYEATAYCDFRSKRLPTLFHWSRAALPSWDTGAPLSPLMARFSNFGQEGAAPVGSHPALSVAGALDMGGNVAEWTSTAGGRGRYCLGGSWSDPAYRINHANSVPPETRDATIGFRACTYQDDEAARKLARSLEFPKIDFASIPPMSDEAFEQTRLVHQRSTSPLAPAVDSTRELPWGAREEWVSIDAGYAPERVPMRLRLPARGKPPHQVVLIVPSLEILFAKSLDGHLYEP